MAWEYITSGDYGFVGKLTVVQDNVVQDISSYTTLQYILTSPHGISSTVTAAFDTDGTDGVLAYTFQDGDIDDDGEWRVRARLSKTGARLTSEEHTFRVER